MKSSCVKYLNFLALLCLVVAYFSSVTFYFSTTFYKELFASFSLAIFLLAIFFQTKIYLHKALLWSELILFIPLLQYGFGLIFFMQDALFACVYVSIFLFSVFVGLNLKASHNKISLHAFLSMLVFVGCVSVAIALNQRFVWVQSDLLFGSSYGNRATANIGQPNQLSTLLIMGLFSLLYLFQIKKINEYFMCIIAFVLIVGIVMTQSRSAWFSCLILSILYLYKHHHKSDILNVIKFNLMFVTLTLSLPFLLNYVAIDKSYSTLERIQGGSTRFKIWPQLFHAVMEHPWTGYGWGQVGVAQLSTMTPKSTKGELFTYSHNLFLDLMVWNGFFIGVILTVLILYILCRCYINLKLKADLMIFLGFIAFFVHACLEYPYAYTYLLIPVGIFLGCCICPQNKNYREEILC